MNKKIMFTAAVFAAVCPSVILAESPGGVSRSEVSVIAHEREPNSVLNAYDKCKIEISDDAKIYAAGNRSGKLLPGYITSDKRQASEFEITINEPGKRVALLLSSRSPAIWSIAWTDGTIIDGAYISGGNAKQMVNGLPEKVKVIKADQGYNSSECAPVFVDENPSSLVPVTSLSRIVFGRPIDAAVLANDGVALLGEPLRQNDKLYSSGYQPSEKLLIGGLLEGDKGLDTLIKSGKLTTVSKESEIVVNYAKKQVEKLEFKPPVLRTVSGDIEPYKAYIPEFHNGQKIYQVNEKIDIPLRVDAMFYVPEGVPLPESGNSRSIFFDMNTGDCISNDMNGQRKCRQFDRPTRYR